MPPLIHEAVGLDGIISFALWSLAVYGVSKALFRSFPAMEFKHWWFTAQASRTERIRRLGWEFKHKMEWSPEIAKNDPLAARIPLDEDQLRGRQEIMAVLLRRSRLWRAVMWLLDCLWCQNFWASAIVMLASFRSPFSWVCSCCAYATAAVCVGLFLERAVEAKDGARKTGGCK